MWNLILASLLLTGNWTQGSSAQMGWTWASDLGKRQGPRWPVSGFGSSLPKQLNLLTIFYQKEETNVHSAKTKMSPLAIWATKGMLLKHLLYHTTPPRGWGSIWSGLALRFGPFRVNEGQQRKEQQHALWVLALWVTDASCLNSPMPRPLLPGFRPLRNNTLFVIQARTKWKN